MMRSLGQLIVIGFSRILGFRFTRFFIGILVTLYFVFTPKRVIGNIHFFRALFTGYSWWAALRLVWRQYHHFSTLYSDSFKRKKLVKDTSGVDGWEHIEEAAVKGRGGILLMSHLGNWQAAAKAFARRKMKIMVFLGARNGEEFDKKMHDNLNSSGVELFVAPADGGHPTDSIEALRFLDRGGFVAMTGDRLWKDDQPYIETAFLGHTVRLPKAPFALALASGRPLFVFFILRKGAGNYREFVYPPINVKAPNRQDRNKVMAEAANSYLSLLEDTLRKHPEHWYHFETFLRERIEP